MYVADFQNRRIQKFSIDGAFLESFGDASIFNRPIDVAERSGNLYVADYGRPPDPQVPRRRLGGRRRRPGADRDRASRESTVNVKVVGDGVGGGAGGVGAARAGACESEGACVCAVDGGAAGAGRVVLDTRRGTVELVSATGSGQKTQSGRFNAACSR